MNPNNKWLVGSVTATLIAAATYWEGTRYTPYEDVVGVLTVCHGYAGKDVQRNKTYTPQECKDLLTRELKSHGEGVLKCVKVPLTQYQYDAFTLFTYNVGVKSFCTSRTVLVPLNEGNYKAACDGLLKWVYAGGQYSNGHYKRRQYERQMCLGELNNVKVAMDCTRWTSVEYDSLYRSYDGSQIGSKASYYRNNEYTQYRVSEKA